jgi:DNA-binding MarR family transcriptional regulator
VSSDGKAIKDQDRSEEQDLWMIVDFLDVIIDWSTTPGARERSLKRANVALPASAVFILRWLDRHASLTVSSLAELLGLHPSTISTQLRPLVDQGLAVRSVDKHDRRVVSLSLTRSGRNACARLRQDAHDSWGEILSSWSGRDKRRLADLVQRAHRDLKSAVAEGLDREALDDERSIEISKRYRESLNDVRASAGLIKPGPNLFP